MAVAHTSRRAFEKDALPTLGARQQCVYDEIEKLPAGDDITDAELASRLVWPINTVTPRRNELMELGIVVKNTTRPCRVTGRLAQAWVLGEGKVTPKKEEQPKTAVYEVTIDGEYKVFRVHPGREAEFLIKFPNAKKI